MSKWIDARVHRLRLSVERLEEAGRLEERYGIEPVIVDPAGGPMTMRWFLRKESSICLKRALALWWGLRWGRR
jgi:hypothetical protein